MKRTFFIILCIVLLIFPVLAAIPRIINYQGKLADVSGIGITDTLDIAFALYPSSIGGSHLWTETQRAVQILKGLFDVHLGSVTAFPDSLQFDEQYFLQVTVDGDVMTPRVALYSVPYAISAGSAIGTEYIDSIHYIDSIAYIDHITYVDSIGYIDSVGHTLFADSAGAVAWTDIIGIPAGEGLSVVAGDTLNVNVRDGIEIVTDTLQIKNGGVSWAKINEEVKDSIRLGSVGGVSSLNTLTGDLDIVGEGGITVEAVGSNIVVELTLAPGDCPLLVDLTDGTGNNQFIPVNLQTFTPSIGQFLILSDEVGCTGGRMYGAILISTSISGSISDIDIWFDNVIISDLSAGSIFPAGDPIISSATLTINPDSTVELEFPHGFVYAGNNILVTMRKNSTAGIFSAWVGKTTTSVNARYNPSDATFPMTSTADFRPNIMLNFLAPEIPDIVNDVNGITGSVNIIGGHDISVTEDIFDLTIDYTGDLASDNDWTFISSDGGDTTMIAGGPWGLSRFGNTLYGNADSTHVNLGVNSVTGTSGSNYKYCTIGGGINNSADNLWTTVSGGSENDAHGPGAVVSGGFLNTAGDSASVVSGGSWNEAGGKYSVVGGGNDNNASGLWATIAGGYSNSASDQNAFIGGGFQNAASGSWSTISGGDRNQALYDYATVGGGRQNTVAGERAVIPGGNFLKIGSRSFGFRGGIGGNPTSITDVSGSVETFHIVDAHFHFNYNNAASNFRVDGTTDNMIFMNATTNRIGFNTNSMSRMLDINGTVGISDTLDMRQNQTINMVLENRTDNPPSPVVGQIWMRIDL
ncbi:hypothetical protein KAH81_06430 [bacterium]|nr:hypothetical protein [bacterium]